MPQFRNPASGGVVTVSDRLADWKTRQGWERIYTDEEIEALKGQELNEALAHEGLPKGGKADEKRARLAEHTGDDPQKEN